MPKRPAITRLCNQYGLPEFRRIIAGGLVPAVRMEPGPRVAAKNMVGISRLGGEPDLHWSEPWPAVGDRPLQFLAQVRLSDVAKAAPRGVLPQSGWLRFWFDLIGEKRRLNTSTRTGGVPPPIVTFDSDERRPVDRRPWPTHRERFKFDWGSPWKAFKPVPLRFSAGWSVAASVRREVSDALWESERSHLSDGIYRIVDAVEERKPRVAHHQLLGDTDEVMSDGRFTAACQAAGVDEFERRSKAAERAPRRRASTYRLLALLDSDRRVPGFEWGDGGNLQWWITEADLRAGRLERAMAVYEQGG